MFVRKKRAKDGEEVEEEKRCVCVHGWGDEGSFYLCVCICVLCALLFV